MFLLFSFLYLSMDLFTFGGWGAGIFFIFLSGGAPPQKTPILSKWDRLPQFVKNMFRLVDRIQE